MKTPTAVLPEADPEWFTATRKNARAIEALRERYPELPFAVEFRHASGAKRSATSACSIC